MPSIFAIGGHLDTYVSSIMWRIKIVICLLMAGPAAVLAQQPAPEPILSPQPAGDTEKPPGENVNWEEMRVDWEDLQDGSSSPDLDRGSSSSNDWPSSSLVWVLGEDDGIGWFGLEDSGVLGYWGPPGFHADLGYSILFLEGPQRVDLNPRLFGFHYGIHARQAIDGPWSYELSIAPGIYSDFEDSAREGVRIQGHAMGMWTQDGLQFVLGIDYLDRENLPLLPIVGVVYEWDEFTRFEAVFPKPRISRLVNRRLESDRWIYVSADYGGYSWAVERDTGLADVVTLNEVCLLLGTEVWNESGHSSEIELGWHFNRDLEFASGLGTFRPQDTFSLRFGSRF